MRRFTIVIALLASACGRIGFDGNPLDGGSIQDAADGGANVDALPVMPGVFVQTFEVTVDVTPKVQTIEAVDMARTFVLCDFRTGSSDHDRLPTCELTTPTTVTVTTDNPEPTLVVRTQIVQLAMGTFVQRGLQPIGSGDTTQDVMIQPVDETRSFVLVSRRGPLASPGFDERYSIRTRLPDPDRLELSRIGTGNNIFVAWQVVELPGARVQQVPGSLPMLSPSASYNITPVNLTRTFLVANQRVSSGEEADGLVRVSMLDADTLSVTRIGTGSLTEVTVYVVETADATVTSGNTPTMALTQVEAGVGSVDPTRTAAFLSVDGGRPGQSADVDETMVTATIEPPVVRFRRVTGTNVTGTVSWQAVEW